jgi:hypothetical protein
MALINEVAITVIQVVVVAYFPILFAAMLLLRPFLERKYNVKIEFSNTSFYQVSGGTPTQRLAIQLGALSLALVGVALLGISVLILMSHPSPSAGLRP